MVAVFICGHLWWYFISPQIIQIILGFVTVVLFTITNCVKIALPAKQSDILSPISLILCSLNNDEQGLISERSAV